MSMQGSRTTGIGQYILYKKIKNDSPTQFKNRDQNKNKNNDTNQNMDKVILGYEIMGDMETP